MAGRTQVQIRTSSGESRHAHRRHEPIQATQELFATARQLWERMEECRPIRFVAVYLTELAEASVNQLDLFGPDQRRSDKVSAVVDKLRERHGEGAVVQARLLKRSDLAPDRVAFGRLTGHAPPGRDDSPPAQPLS